MVSGDFRPDAGRLRSENIHLDDDADARETHQSVRSVLAHGLGGVSTGGWSQDQRRGPHPEQMDSHVR